MSQEPEDNDLEPEYDFSGAVRGKYYQRYQQGTNVILLDADVAQAFKDSESVNRALRLLLDLAKHEVSSEPLTRTSRPAVRACCQGPRDPAWRLQSALARASEPSAGLGVRWLPQS